MLPQGEGARGRKGDGAKIRKFDNRRTDNPK